MAYKHSIMALITNIHDLTICGILIHITAFIIHQTRYEKSDWSRAFNQFTIACELDMINAISAADIAFIVSSSTSAWLLSPLECSAPSASADNTDLQSRPKVVGTLELYHVSPIPPNQCWEISRFFQQKGKKSPDYQH